LNQVKAGGRLFRHRDTGINLPETIMIHTQVGRMLDEEHHTNLDLLGRLEQAAVRHQRLDAATLALLGEFARALEHDVTRHFAFEEEQLFPRLEDSGDGAIAALMRQEHDDIRALAEELLPLARQAAGGGLEEAGWRELRQGVLEMVERQVAHIQKETMAVLPLLDDLLDPMDDAELALAYAG
jgi:hemerythrin-like domain-containing protein